MMTTRSSSTRLDNKELTRRALIRAALTLHSHNSFDSLSLRQITREAGITPAAFYRHFADMEELGLVLVEESVRSLGALREDVRGQVRPSGNAIRTSLAVLVRHLDAHRAHFRFMVRERYGGLRRLRRAIDRELQLFADELAVDLAAVPGIDRWTMVDRRMLAGGAAELSFHMVAQLLESVPGEERDIIDCTERQLRLVFLGVPRWSA
jgi:AcrR family transcriptional regulator